MSASEAILPVSKTRVVWMWVTSAWTVRIAADTEVLREEREVFSVVVQVKVMVTTVWMRVKME